MSSPLIRGWFIKLENDRTKAVESVKKIMRHYKIAIDEIYSRGIREERP